MNGMISLQLPADVLNAAGMTLDELRLEMAIHLFEQRRLSLGRAARLAGMEKGDFVPLLGQRQISIFGDEEQMVKDAEMLSQLRLSA